MEQTAPQRPCVALCVISAAVVMYYWCYVSQSHISQLAAGFVAVTGEPSHNETRSLFDFHLDNFSNTTQNTSAYLAHQNNSNDTKVVGAVQAVRRQINAEHNATSGNKRETLGIQKDREVPDKTLLDDQHPDDKPKPPKYHVTVKCRGRLGNQMFMYAALLAYSRLHPDSVAYITMTTCGMLRQAFNGHLSIWGPVTEPVLNLATSRYDNRADEGVEKLKLPIHRNTNMLGWFQSYKYFDNYENDIRKEFTFPQNVSDRVADYFKNVTPPEWKGSRYIRVGIQVRRGDQLRPGRLKLGFVEHPPSYFRHAMDYFLARYDRVQFIVASDDPHWCQTYITGQHVEYTRQDYVMDLATMSMCDHIIKSIGTYSWWAGWLCKGTTVYYGKLPPPDTYMGVVYHNNSMIPPDSQYNHWIPVV